MIAELRARLEAELERLSGELATRADDPARAEVERILRRRMQLFGKLVAGLPQMDPHTLWPDRAGFGSVVRVRDVAGGEEETYTLMTGDFIDLDEGHVSLASPLGHALLGHTAGEQVSVRTPRGERRYEILALTTLPQRLGLTDSGEAMQGPVGSLQVA